MTYPTISIVIPTYNREQVLIETIESLLIQEKLIEEILIIDQTNKHSDDVDWKLRSWNGCGRIKWIRLQKPSIPAAMNRGLVEASSDIVLFLDDDIIPDDRLVRAHLDVYSTIEDIVAVVGKIVQPEDKMVWSGFCFDSDIACYVKNVMAGNLSVNREKAIAIGGFDENFIGAAFNFETEFAERLILSNGNIRYEPKAGIKHLRTRTGGVRAHGDFSKTILPLHSVGAYYYFLRSPNLNIPEKTTRCVTRITRSIYTKHHLKNPWYIPATIIAEFSGFLYAIFLFLKGAKLIKNNLRGEQKC